MHQYDLHLCVVCSSNLTIIILENHLYLYIWCTLIICCVSHHSFCFFKHFPYILLTNIIFFWFFWTLIACQQVPDCNIYLWFPVTHFPSVCHSYHQPVSMETNHPTSFLLFNAYPRYGLILRRKRVKCDGVFTACFQINLNSNQRLAHFTGVQELSTRLKVIELVLQQLTVVLWFIHRGLLPENDGMCWSLYLWFLNERSSFGTSHQLILAVEPV